MHVKSMITVIVIAVKLNKSVTWNFINKIRFMVKLFGHGDKPLMIKLMNTVHVGNDEEKNIYPPSSD